MPDLAGYGNEWLAITSKLWINHDRSHGIQSSTSSEQIKDTYMAFSSLLEILQLVGQKITMYNQSFLRSPFFSALLFLHLSIVLPG